MEVKYNIPYTEEPLYSDRQKALKAFLLLSGAVALTRFGLKGQVIKEVFSAPALIGGESLAGGVYEGTAHMFTQSASWQVLKQTDRWMLYQDPTDARSLLLASENTRRGRKRWSDLTAEEVADRADFAFEYIEMLGSEHKIVHQTQLDLAALIWATRESINKVLRDPSRKAAWLYINKNCFFHPERPKTQPHKKILSMDKR